MQRGAGGAIERKPLLPSAVGHLQARALYKVNTGRREQEVCKLRWEWEIKVPELETSVFLIPADFGGGFEDSGVKNGEERLVVLNDVARSIICKQRGLDPEWAFPYEGRALHRMNDTAWRSARKRAADVPEEDRKALLGHTDGSYHFALLGSRADQADRVCKSHRSNGHAQSGVDGAQARGGFNGGRPRKSLQNEKGG